MADIITDEELNKVIAEIIVERDTALAQNAALAERIAGLERWKESVIDCCVLNHIGWHEDDPQKTLSELINYEIQVSLDPLVSSSAQALVDSGFSRAQAQLATAGEGK